MSECEAAMAHAVGDAELQPQRASAVTSAAAVRCFLTATLSPSLAHFSLHSFLPRRAPRKLSQPILLLMHMRSNSDSDNSSATRRKRIDAQQPEPQLFPSLAYQRFSASTRMDCTRFLLRDLPSTAAACVGGAMHCSKSAHATSPSATSRPCSSSPSWPHRSADTCRHSTGCIMARAVCWRSNSCSIFRLSRSCVCR